jgi:hypothetical protein
MKRISTQIIMTADTGMAAYGMAMAMPSDGEI